MIPLDPIGHKDLNETDIMDLRLKSPNRNEYFQPNTPLDRSYAARSNKSESRVEEINVNFEEIENS
jgi:hypothetical protein